MVRAAVDSRGPVAVLVQQEVGQLLQDGLVVQRHELLPTDLPGEEEERSFG